MRTDPNAQNPPAPKSPAAPVHLPVMPDFTVGTHAFRHTMDSALACLAEMRITPARIQLQCAGHSTAPDGTVVAQSPSAGQALAPDTQIRLEITGLGFTHALPAGMWDSGGEAEPGTREMLGGIDDPLLKLAHWSHEGAALFRISEDDAAACERWMTLFGVQCADWPQDMWFQLASLLAQVPALASSEEGVRLALGLLFHIPVARVRYERSVAMIPRSKTTLLGARASRLGIETVTGDAVEVLAHPRITLGPVSLKTYEAFAEGEQRKALLRVLDYMMPAFLDFKIEWLVEDARQCPRLGVAERNSRLGVNAYLGSAA